MDMHDNVEQLAQSVLRSTDKGLDVSFVNNMYGSSTNFFQSYCLKPWDVEHQAEAVALSEAIQESNERVEAENRK